MTANIVREYKKAGVSTKRSFPGGGRNIHTLRAHKAVIRYLKQGMSRDEAWKRVVGGMGKYAIKPSHRRTTK